MNRIFTVLLLLVGSVSFAQQQLKSPSEFLGYELGDRFTRHHAVVDYFKYVDNTLSNVQVIQYGETYEKRPLVVAIIASPENFAQLEQIRQDNLKRTGMMSGQPSTKVGIVWLSYNVHGNEANSTETSMKTLFELVNPLNTKSSAWLKNTVVIIDPCINPDGRDRFANFFNQYGNRQPNSDPQAREHREPWPGGRPNHYLFDLNRDWAWLTQTESQGRIKLYNQWMPHVHVDFHEQGINQPYFFAPAAEPMHEVITPWQKQLQQMIGKNNAKYFDEQGWLYFTGERFDIYYPSYGDSYPTYNGAIGMTYEQGGIGAGVSVTTQEGDPMTLKDRIAHHYTTGMATVETASVNSTKMVDEFEKYFKENGSMKVPYKTYVLKGDNNRDKLKNITQWMDAHAIKFGVAGSSKPLKGFDYQTQTQATFTLSAEDIVVNIDQPKGRFITTVFEPQSKLNDSLTYDVTAWNLIYGSGLKAYALAEKIDFAKPYQASTATISGIETPYTYICRYQSLADAQFLAALLMKGIAVRAAVKPFTLAGQSYEQGTLLITKRNNEDIVDFNKTVRELAVMFDRNIVGATTGLTDSGPNVGSSDIAYLKIPKIALLGGDQTSSQSHGQVWHYLEQTLNYPVSVIGTDYFKSVDLDKYNVLIIPDGGYRLFDEETLGNLARWVSSGGRLILLERANNAFANKSGFVLKPFDAGKKEDDKKVDNTALVAFADAERKSLSSSLFGAIYKVTIDKTHPLGFGLSSTYYTLKTNELHYSYLKDAWNVGTLRGKVKPVLGFSGKKINDELANSLLFGVEDKGQGQIIYMADNPLFRCFWEDGKLLFANALFMGN
jgi:hypothetical protein